MTIEAVAEHGLYLTHYFDPYDVIENNKLKSMLEAIRAADVKTLLYKDLF